MAVVDGYTSKVLAQGQIGTQASGNDFGAQVGGSLENAGAGVSSMAQAVYQNEVADEVTAAHQLAAKKRLEWEQTVVDRGNQAVPGDRTFAPKLIEDINTDMENSASQFKTKRAQEVFASLSSDMKSTFGTKAIHVQSQLDGQDAKNKFVSTIEDLSKLANGDATQYASLAKQAEAMIDDPDGTFAKVPKTSRDEFKKLAKQALASSSVEGYFARDIYAAAEKLLPDMVKGLFEQAKPPESPTATPTAAGQPDFSGLDIKQARRLQAVQLSPANVAAIDAAAGGDAKKAAFLRAVVTIENRGKKAPDDNAVSPAGATGAFQFLASTGQQYGLSTADRNNFAKSAAAAGKFYDDLNRMYGGNQAAMLAHYNGGVAAARAVVNGGQPPAQETRDYLKMGLALGVGGQSTTPLGEPAAPTFTGPQLKVHKDAALQPPQGVDIPGWNDMTLDSQQAMMKKLITDFNSRITVDRATLADDRKNMTANFLAGNNYDGEKQLQSRYAQAYGPEMAQRMVAEDNNAKQLGVFSKSVKGKSMDEITAAMGQPPSDNASADDYDTYRKKIAVVQADRQELAKNPVEYVARYSTAVQQASTLVQAARAEADKRPGPDTAANVASATQKFITASLAEQKRLGVADPQILSENEEKVLTQKIEQIVGSGRDVAQSIDALYKSYGSYGPTVAAQMSKKVGGLMNVIGSGIDSNAATLLIEANRNKADLEKTLPPDKTKDLDVAVRDVMRDYSASLTGVPNGAQVQGNYQEQISLLALARMSKLGESQKEAVKNAYQQLVGDQYNFQDGYRVPKAVDAKVVRNQTQYLLNSLSPSDVALLPGSLGNAEDRMQAQLASIRTHGKWVTTSQMGTDGRTEEGLTLMVPTPGGYAPVPAPNGKPLFKSFGELVIDYQSKNIQTSQDALMRGDMRSYDRLRTQERANQRKLEDQRVVDQAREFRARNQGLIK